MKIGLISDTHGLLRPRTLEVLAGCELILHGGDIGGPKILQSLGSLAPVQAVHGNNDHGEWAEALPHSLELELGEQRLCLVHQPHTCRLTSPSAASPWPSAATAIVPRSNGAVRCC